MCLCIVLKVYCGHKYLFSFNIKASNIEWVLNCDTYSPCSLGVSIYPPPFPYFKFPHNFLSSSNKYVLECKCNDLTPILTCIAIRLILHWFVLANLTPSAPPPPPTVGLKVHRHIYAHVWSPQSCVNITAEIQLLMVYNCYYFEAGKCIDHNVPLATCADCDHQPVTWFRLDRLQWSHVRSTWKIRQFQIERWWGRKVPVNVTCHCDT